jgi:hypothetical protein
LDITTLVTLSDAYLGIDPHFDMLNYIFCVYLPQVSDMAVVVLGGVVLHVKSRHGIDPYFDLPIPKSVNEWQKIWFSLRNDAATLLPIFMGNCPVPQPNWGHGLAKKDHCKLQPLYESFNSYGRRADSRAPSANIFEPSSSTTPLAGVYNGAVSRAKLV